MEVFALIDIHCHILPSVDDGAADMEKALAMAQMAAAHGTTALVATPHVVEGGWLPAWEDILDLTASLNAALAAQGATAIPIYPGAEVAVNFDILDQIKGPGPYCINGGSYMLVELPALDIPCYADEFFFTLQARGITPILSHPERHPLIADDPAIVLEWVRRGLLIQINAPSLAGKMGERALKTAEVLVKSRLVHFLGTDAHGLHARPPCLTAGAEKLTSLVGRDAARQILVANPGRVIQNLPVEAPEVEKIAEPDRPGMLRQWISKFCAR